jgi:uncharacterized membrane protein
MEAFSDGVFAITITLLVLDLVVPEIEEGDAGHALIEQWPMYLTYFVSFASIGAAWMVHSAITEQLDHVDPIELRLNLLLLFVVSVLPFTTKMMGEYLADADAERIGVTIYGLNLLAMSAMGSVVWRYAAAQRLIKADRSEEEVRAMTTKLNPSLGFYALAIGIGLLAPPVAVFLYLAIALYLLIPFRAIAQHLSRQAGEG